MGKKAELEAALAAETARADAEQAKADTLRRSLVEARFKQPAATLPSLVDAVAEYRAAREALDAAEKLEDDTRTANQEAERARYVANERYRMARSMLEAAAAGSRALPVNTWRNGVVTS